MKSLQRPQSRVDWTLSRPSALLLAVVVIAISSSGPIIALSTAPVLAMALWRCVFGSILTLPFAIKSQDLFTLTKTQWRFCVASGIALAIHFCLWIPSVRLTSVANSVALVATQPIWMLLMSRYQGYEIPRRAWLGILIAVSGVFIVVGFDFTVSTRALVGDIMSLLSAIAAGAYLIIGGQVRQQVSNSTYTTIVYGISSVFIYIAAFFLGTQLWGFSKQDWLLIGALTLGAQLLGHSLMSRLMSTTSSNVVGIAVLFEPPGAAIFAALLLGQHIALSALVGMAIILGGLVMVVWQSKPK
mgnify:CR=1 FL=1